MWDFLRKIFGEEESGSSRGDNTLVVVMVFSFRLPGCRRPGGSGTGIQKGGCPLSEIRARMQESGSGIKEPNASTTWRKSTSGTRSTLHNNDYVQLGIKIKAKDIGILPQEVKIYFTPLAGGLPQIKDLAHLFKERIFPESGRGRVHRTPGNFYLEKIPR